MNEIFDRHWLSDGIVVKEFEVAVSAYLGVKHCVAICNGTTALELAIRALELKGEVIVPSYTFIATAHALQWLGITPVFADIDPATHTLDPLQVRRMISPRTTGILGVHLWGRASEIDALQTVADENGLQLLFDAAHAFGVSYHQQMIGGFGRCEILSFHATKFFNTFEGGAITTNDDALAEKIRRMRNFGFKEYDKVVSVGTNGKMSEPCAAMGLVNLESLPQFIDTNQRNYNTYRQHTADLPGVRLLPYDEGERNNFQYIVLEIGPAFGKGRDEVVETLHAHNVLARKYFWPGCHRMSPYNELWPEAYLNLPNTEAVAKKVIVLPTGTAISEADISKIVEIIRRCHTNA